MSTAVSTDNAPRDMEGLKELKPHRRYSLALALGIIQNGSQEEQAFLASTPDIQSQAISQALTARDAVNGTNPGFGGPMTQPLQTTQAPLVPTQYIPQQLQQSAAPQVAPQYAPLPPAGAPAWQGQQTQSWQPPRAVPVPLPPQAAVAQPQLPVPPQNGRNPVTAGDPRNTGAGAQQPQPVAFNLGELQKAIQDIRNELEFVPGLDDLNELKELVLGGLRTQRIIGLMLLELASNSLGAEKQLIINMMVAMSKNGDYERLLQNAAGAANEGKG